MPFDSHEYVVHFRLIKPVEKKGGGGGCCLLWRGSTRGGCVCVGGGGGLMLSPFGPFNQCGGGGVAVRFGAVQPGGGGGGGGLSPFGSFNQWGGGGGGCCPLSAHSISGEEGIYVNFYYKGCHSFPKGGGGGAWPPVPTLGTPMTGSAGLAYLVGALQALPMVLM